MLENESLLFFYNMCNVRQHNNNGYDSWFEVIKITKKKFIILGKIFQIFRMIFIIIFLSDFHIIFFLCRKLKCQIEIEWSQESRESLYFFLNIYLNSSSINILLMKHFHSLQFLKIYSFFFSSFLLLFCCCFLCLICFLEIK